MAVYELPGSVEVCGVTYTIRTDFRCVLDIFAALSDPELEEWEKVQAVLEIFYFSPGSDEIPPKDWQEAIDRCFWFISGGEDCKTGNKGPKVMDWEQDFRLITAPVSRVYGQDIRAVPYNPKTNEGGLHWWTFLSYYMEIGDCLFAQVVRIRDMKARGKRLDKQDREFYRRNQDLVDIKTRYTENEDDFFRQWSGAS